LNLRAKCQMLTKATRVGSISVTDGELILGPTLKAKAMQDWHGTNLYDFFPAMETERILGITGACSVCQVWVSTLP
jgi:hypothetical protein